MAKAPDCNFGMNSIELSVLKTKQTLPAQKSHLGSYYPLMPDYTLSPLSPVFYYLSFFVL